MSTPYRPPRLLIIPGLNDSDSGHWQTWLQAQFPGSRRVVQHRPQVGELERWSARIQDVLDQHPETDWVAAAHSFGVLALAHHLALVQQRGERSRIRQALLVAPAEPDRFGVAELLPHRRLPVPTTLIASQNDPWMSSVNALRWASRWGSSYSNLGWVGHINTEAGFGPFPLAKRWVDAALAKAARDRRPEHADFREWSFAV